MIGYTQTVQPCRVRIQDKRYPRKYKKMLKRGIKIKLCKYRYMRKILNPGKPEMYYAIMWDGQGNPMDAWDSYNKQSEERNINLAKSLI